MDWTERARRFRDLHRPGSPFLLPSVDPVGARDLAAMGFAAAEARSIAALDGALLVCVAVEGATPDLVARWIEAGCVGVRLDDAGLADDAALERVRAIAGVSADLVVTACSHRHLEGGTLDDSLERLTRYREAGARVVEAPGLRRAEHIRRVVDELEVVNVTLGLGGVPPSMTVLAELGVARVSTGRVLPELGIGSARLALREMLEHGTFEFLVELD